MILDKAMIVNYNRNCRFIVLATINMIINYAHKTFIVQATGIFYSLVLYFKVRSVGKAQAFFAAPLVTEKK